MFRYLSLISSISLVPALARAQGTTGAEGIEPASAVSMWLFAGIFFGMCVLYVWFTWRNEKRRRHDQKANPAGPESTDIDPKPIK